MTVEMDEGSANVYADLGYANAEEMQRKSSLAAEIARSIKARHLTQEAAAALLGIDQAKISKITRGQFRGVSEAKMLELVAKLGHNIKITIGKTKRLTRDAHDKDFPLAPLAPNETTLAAMREARAGGLKRFDSVLP